MDKWLLGTFAGLSFLLLFLNLYIQHCINEENRFNECVNCYNAKTLIHLERSESLNIIHDINITKLKNTLYTIKYKW